MVECDRLLFGDLGVAFGDPPVNLDVSSPLNYATARFRERRDIDPDKKSKQLRGVRTRF